MKISRKDLEANLPKKGFAKDEQGHHVYFIHLYGGKKTGIYTKISHTKKIREISNDLLTAVRKQLRLDRNDQVRDLAECPMTEAEYVSLLRQKGLLPPEAGG